MKAYRIIPILLLAGILAGCSSSNITTTINFDNLSLNIQSSKEYKIKDIDKKAYPGIAIYQESGDNSKDTFINSLIIAAQENISLNIKDFINKNIATVQTSIGSTKIQSSKTAAFNCYGENIVGMIKNFKVTENNKDSYFSQLFFLHNNKGYIISFNADNQSDNTDFKTSLNSLTCTK